MSHRIEPGSFFRICCRHTSITAVSFSICICDLNYIEIRRDPIAAVRRIYEHFGWLLSQKAEQRMRLVVASQAHEQSGLHRYDLSQFCLDPAEGAEAFAAYCERFDLSAQAVGRPSHRAKRLVLK